MTATDRAALLALLQKRLGYTFKALDLLDHALTHKSYANEIDREHDSYERLEFLGDAVLGLIMSTYLYITYPASSEGQLSKLRAHIVSESGLASLARHLDLGRFLMLGRGEEQTGGRHKHSLLAAALEAIVAAIYLDGGLATAEKVFLECFAPTIKQCLASASERDYKGLLQKYALSTFGRLPMYRIVREEGLDHQKTFHVKLTLDRTSSCMGMGRSKKAAEQQAAKKLLEQLQEKHQCS